MAKKPRFQWEEASENSEFQDQPSRSAKKRAAQALQDLGTKLLKLESPILHELNLSSDLIKALEEYRTISKNEAKRRQLQYIGRLMREEKPETLEILKKVLAN